MNPEPLKSYQAKAYNPGSPAPNPKKEQFSNFPINKDLDEFEFSSCITPKDPLKLTICNKRKLDAERDFEFNRVSPVKKTKMSDEFQNKVIQFMTDMNDKMDTSNKELGDKMDKLTESVQEFKDYKVATDQRLSTVESDIAALKTQIDQGINEADIDKVKAALIPELEASLSAKFNHQFQSSHKEKLAKENFEHDHILLVYGFKKECTIEEATKFLRDEMKVPSDTLQKIKIREVIRLGRVTEGSRPPPVSIKFGHPSQ